MWTSATAIARERAEAANRAKSEFLATMSHEIRDPMHGVLWMLDLLTDSGSMPSSRSSWRWRASRPVPDGHHRRRVGSVGIEAGRLQLEVLPFDPRLELVAAAETLAGALRGARSGIPGRGLARPADHASGDARRLRQVIANPVANAVKFTRPGRWTSCSAWDPIQVRVRWRCRSVWLTLGLGFCWLPATIFELFSQGRRVDHRLFGGTRLGPGDQPPDCRADGRNHQPDSAVGEGACSRSRSW